jgi:hypothetical protein
LLAAIGVSALGSVILVANAFVLKREADLSELRSPRRYWEDVCAGAKDFLDHKYGPEPATGASMGPDEASEACSRLVIGGTSRQTVRPWQFWRTINLRPFIQQRDRLLDVPPLADPGRAAAAGIGFRLLDGISPFLVMWLGVFATIPVLWWAAGEFASARMGWAGVAFVILLASSPFLVDGLTLGHSGVGFYMIAIVAIVPLAVYAIHSDRVSARGLLVRALAAGLVYGSSAACRSGAVALAPGFLLALVLGWRRMELGSGRPRWVVLAAGVVLLVAPYAMLRPARHHDVWITIWEGLGDFDRTKGHYWDDEEAKRSLVAAGLPLGRGLYGWATGDAETHFKDAVLRDIASDPVWFGRILLRRLWATVTEEKLRAWSAKDWRSIAASLTPQESGMSKHFSWVTPVNRIGAGHARVAVPVVLLMAPTVALLALAVPGRLGPRIAGLREASRRALATTACMAAGAVMLPVAITSASMVETQAFAFVYYLGLALLVQEMVGLLAGRLGRPYATPAAPVGARSTIASVAASQ